MPPIKYTDPMVSVNIRIVQELMGHTDVKTTEIYTHVMEKDLSVISSPLDLLSSPDKSFAS